MFLNFGDELRAQQFLETRLQQGLSDTTIKTFQVPNSYIESLRTTAVAESQAKLFPASPIMVDVNQAADQFGLRAANFDELLSNIVPGSGNEP